MKNTFETIIVLIIWILGLLAAYMLILKITNHSPTVDQIQNTVLALMGTLVIAIIIQFSNIYYRLGKIESTLKYNSRDLKNINLDLKDIKKSLT
ncbi:MAG: hypothetical protein ABIJ18_02480 [archaeon]